MLGFRLQLGVTTFAQIAPMATLHPLRRVAVHEYYGQPDSHGNSGRLQIFKICQTDTAVQPTENPYKAAVLNSGHTIPRIGLGTWKSEKGQVKHAVYEALKVGYRHIDCAAIYENEHEVGAALQQAFAQGVTVRERLFVTSKLW